MSDGVSFREEVNVHLEQTIRCWRAELAELEAKGASGWKIRSHQARIRRAEAKLDKRQARVRGDK